LLHPPSAQKKHFCCPFIPFEKWLCVSIPYGE
jgi:hypothetical protein